MNYLKGYTSFLESNSYPDQANLTDNINDILAELEDDGFLIGVESDKSRCFLKGKAFIKDHEKQTIIKIDYDYKVTIDRKEQFDFRKLKKGNAIQHLISYMDEMGYKYYELSFDEPRSSAILYFSDK